MNLIIHAVDHEDSRPVWYSDWGTDVTSGTNNMRRALDRILKERGPEGYGRFKSRIRLSSFENFGPHTDSIEPPFTLWVNTFQPERNGKRWYHRFSAITARAGGFDLVRDVLTGHGALGAMYPTNTTHWQKEGDTMSFLYLVPTGMNNPEEPEWGSWAGRYGPNGNYPGRHYFWANQEDAWNGTTNRDNTLARWAEALQNDFRARLDWCVKPYSKANHPPSPKILQPQPRAVKPGERIILDATQSSDPDNNELTWKWEFYQEPGNFSGPLEIADANTALASFRAPEVTATTTLHILLSVTDSGAPPLTRYARLLVRVSPPARASAQQFIGSKAGDEREVAGIKLCWCPPGHFRMGSPPSEPERRPDEGQVEVTLSKGFWTGKYELTQGEWKQVMGKLPGELTVAGGTGDDFAVYNVNYAEAEAFSRKLTEAAHKSGELPADWQFRLPTEAQWEYACRAGTSTATAFGDRLSSKQANFQGRPYNGDEKGPSLNRATRVGSYPANNWGLHDMHGNMYEWCRDWYHQKLPGGDDPDLSAVKGSRNRDGTYSRVRRGGAFCDDGSPCRSAARLRYEPERRYDHIGFRIVAVRP